MDTVDLIIKSSTEFYNDLKADENGRYRSWEHCYSHFIKARESKEVDYDYLSLQLAFYLASWGMYRGEYSCAVTPQIRQMGNHLSGNAGTAYASLLA